MEEEKKKKRKELPAGSARSHPVGIPQLSQAQSQEPVIVNALATLPWRHRSIYWHICNFLTEDATRPLVKRGVMDLARGAHAGWENRVVNAGMGESNLNRFGKVSGPIAQPLEMVIRAVIFLLRGIPLSFRETRIEYSREQLFKDSLQTFAFLHKGNSSTRPALPIEFLSNDADIGNFREWCGRLFLHVIPPIPGWLPDSYEELSFTPVPPVAGAIDGVVRYAADPRGRSAYPFRLLLRRFPRADELILAPANWIQGQTWNVLLAFDYVASARNLVTAPTHGRLTLRRNGAIVAGHGVVYDERPVSVAVNAVNAAGQICVYEIADLGNGPGGHAGAFPTRMSIGTAKAHVAAIASARAAAAAAPPLSAVAEDALYERDVHVSPGAEVVDLSREISGGSAAGPLDWTARNPFNSSSRGMGSAAGIPEDGKHQSDYSGGAFRLPPMVPASVPAASAARPAAAAAAAGPMAIDSDVPFGGFAGTGDGGGDDMHWNLDMLNSGFIPPGTPLLGGGSLGEFAYGGSGEVPAAGSTVLSLTPPLPPVQEPPPPNDPFP